MLDAISCSSAGSKTFALPLVFLHLHFSYLSHNYFSIVREGQRRDKSSCLTLSSIVSEYDSPSVFLIQRLASFAEIADAAGILYNFN
jgi:hypothetical protein